MQENLAAYKVQIHTTTYRTYGSIYLPAGQTVAERLNSDAQGLLPVTSPLIYAPGLTNPPAEKDLRISSGFLAIHHDQIIWLVGSSTLPFHGARPKRDQPRHALMCGDHLLVGTMAMGDATRSSDFLRAAKPFQTLFDVALYPWQAASGRILLLGDQGKVLFEVASEARHEEAVTELSAVARFEQATVNLRQTFGVLEAPGSASGNVKSMFIN